jgi:rubrerythrin
MIRSKEDVANVLKKAIRGEEDGYYFYNFLSEKADNPEARKKLEILRDDEIRHRKTLCNLYDKYIGGEIGELPPKGINALAEIFKKGRLEQRHTEVDFLNLAIEAELAAMKYYQSESDLIDDKEFKEIFAKLADEEHSHYEWLIAERDAISGNYYWFDLGDSSSQEH